MPMWSGLWPTIASINRMLTLGVWHSFSVGDALYYYILSKSNRSGSVALVNY